jgi:hypothetical protein
VLQDGHAACFLVQRVEKPTDKKISRCFATATDASALLWRSVVIGPGAIWTRAGASDSFEVPVPLLKPAVVSGVPRG